VRFNNKFRAKRCEIDGIKFASKAEAKRYLELKLLEKNKRIKGLALQVSYPLVVNGFKICTYIADFVYQEDGKTIVEDKKGMILPIFKLKMKLMKALYGIDIRIT